VDTWNPITGCMYNCLYCWARNYAKRLAAMNVEPYRTHGFKPNFAEWRLKQKFPKGGFTFVSDMGEMWGEWVPREWILKVLNVLTVKPKTRFLFLTKNPRRYHEFLDIFTDNMLLGATIETNRSCKISRAPPQKERFEAMKKLDWKHKAVVIEPILDFDPEFIDWIKEIKPEMVYVGYDNYNNRLSEPQLSKTQTFVNQLQRTMQVEARNLRKAWFET
jgi:DNA repair photolyase